MKRLFGRKKTKKTETAKILLNEHTRQHRRHSMPAISPPASSSGDFCIDPTAAFLAHANASSRRVGLDLQHAMVNASDRSIPISPHAKKYTANRPFHHQRRRHSWAEETKEEEKTPSQNNFIASNDFNSSFCANDLLRYNESSKKRTAATAAATSGGGDSSLRNMSSYGNSARSITYSHYQNGAKSNNSSSTVDFTRRNFIEDEDDDSRNVYDNDNDKDCHISEKKGNTRSPKRRNVDTRSPKRRNMSPKSDRTNGRPRDGSSAALDESTTATKRKVKRVSMDTSAYEKADAMMKSLSEIEDFLLLLQNQDDQRKHQFLSESLLRCSKDTSKSSKLPSSKLQKKSKESLWQQQRQYTPTRRQNSLPKIDDMSQSMNDASQAVRRRRQSIIENSSSSMPSIRVRNPRLDEKINRGRNKGLAKSAGISQSMNDTSQVSRRRRHSVDGSDYKRFLLTSYQVKTKRQSVQESGNIGESKALSLSAPQQHSGSWRTNNESQIEALPILLETQSAHHRHPITGKGSSNDKASKQAKKTASDQSRGLVKSDDISQFMNDTSQVSCRRRHSVDRSNYKRFLLTSNQVNTKQQSVQESGKIGESKALSLSAPQQHSGSWRTNNECQIEALPILLETQSAHHRHPITGKGSSNDKASKQAKKTASDQSRGLVKSDDISQFMNDTSQVSCRRRHSVDGSNYKRFLLTSNQVKTKQQSVQESRKIGESKALSLSAPQQHSGAWRINNERQIEELPILLETQSAHHRHSITDKGSSSHKSSKQAKISSGKQGHSSLGSTTSLLPEHNLTRDGREEHDDEAELSSKSPKEKRKSRSWKKRLSLNSALKKVKKTAKGAIRRRKSYSLSPPRSRRPSVEEFNQQLILAMEQSKEEYRSKSNRRHSNVSGGKVSKRSKSQSAVKRSKSQQRQEQRAGLADVSNSNSKT